MKRTPKSKCPVSAETIARWADQGKDVSRYFTNKGQMMPPIERVEVGFTTTMVHELDEAAKELNVSREAVIITFVRQALDLHYLARRTRIAS